MSFIFTKECQNELIIIIIRPTDRGFPPTFHVFDIELNTLHAIMHYIELNSKQ